MNPAMSKHDLCLVWFDLAMKAKKQVQNTGRSSTFIVLIFQDKSYAVIERSHKNGLKRISLYTSNNRIIGTLKAES